MQTYTQMAVASTSKMTLSSPTAARARVAALPAWRRRNARFASTGAAGSSNKSTAGEQQGGQWMKKQMEMMERTENRKSKNALKVGGPNLPRAREEEGQLVRSVTGRAETVSTPPNTLQQDQDVPFGACTSIRSYSQAPG